MVAMLGLGSVPHDHGGCRLKLSSVEEDVSAVSW